MRKFFLLIALLSKRLYKKASFIFILAVLVGATVGAGAMLSQESSMVEIAVVLPQENSQTAQGVVNSLKSSTAIVNYTICTEKEALNLLKSGRVDAVWQFEEYLDSAIEKYIQSGNNTAPIKVYSREQSIFVNLTLERLYAELYPLIARQYYLSYGHENFSIEDESYYLSIYDEMPRNRDIFEYSYYNNSAESAGKTSYLVSPLRGILAVILTLCALSCALYFMHDCDIGNMDRTPINRRWGMQALYALTGSANIALFVLAALYFSGITMPITQEITAMLLFILASVGFALSVSGLAGKTVRLAGVLPILVITMLAVCPVFLNLEIKYVSSLFPAYWYLNAVYNPSKMSGLAIYAAIMLALSFVLWRKRKYVK